MAAKCDYVCLRHSGVKYRENRGRAKAGRPLGSSERKLLELSENCLTMVGTKAYVYFALAPRFSSLWSCCSATTRLWHTVAVVIGRLFGLALTVTATTPKEKSEPSKRLSGLRRNRLVVFFCLFPMKDRSISARSEERRVGKECRW